ncbi:MAG: hypothetical protein M1828_002431 [Chrysothrix sp. TS-e1954]|nr:MAG: hypothetical protein M1828_002431 [Chrysothrix sp. TS-e1954]
MSTYEKAVKGATKIKLAPPKAKYIETILNGTRVGEPAVAEIFKTLQLRIRDSTWTIAFKALIVTHLMIREGASDTTLQYLGHNYRKLITVTNYTDVYAVQTQGKNILFYSGYLSERSKSYNRTRQDYVGGAQNRLKKLSVDKGLLRECESVQAQIQALLFGEEPENDISLTAFRLLVMDLLVLFQVMNEGTINVLERYFEMSQPDAERALAIYKTFARQTDLVVRYLSLARQYEYSTRIEIPKIKHAPTSLAASLEEYLNDQDFEVNRRQYLASQDMKTGAKPGGGLKKSFTEPSAGASKATFPSPPRQKETTTAAPAKGPAPDLIDFFGSIEQKQQPLAQDPSQYSQNAFSEPFSAPPQQTVFSGPANGYGGNQSQSAFMGNNPFGQFQQPQAQFQAEGQFEQNQGQYQQPQSQYQQPQTQYQQPQTQFQQPQMQQPPQQYQQQQPQIQPQNTGAGFGGYTPQPQSPTPQMPSYGHFNNTSTMPFAQQQTGSSQSLQQNQQPSNPFRQSSMPISFGQSPQTTGNPFAHATPPPVQSPPLQSPPPTGFQQQMAQQQPQQMMPQQTGTNPFARASPATNSQSQGANQSPAGNVFSQATGSTNPFKQSAFVNQQTGQGWQNGPQNTMGGFEQLETVPIFPRPGQQSQQQQNPCWVMLSPSEGFTHLPGEERIGQYPARIGMSLQSLNKYPSKEPFAVSSSTGRIFLTNRRIVYLPDSSTTQLQSFAAPLLNLHDTHITAPFFGPNAWLAVVQPVINGGIPSRHPALELKLTFKDGGAVDFHAQFIRIKERMQQVMDVARTTGQGTGSGGVNMDAVHLDELPAYEATSSVPTTTQPSNPPAVGQATSPMNNPRSSGNATNTPAEPPPGYEEVQRDSIAESLDRDLRLQH